MNKLLTIIVMPDKTIIPEWTDTKASLSETAVQLQATIAERINDDSRTWLFFAGFLEAPDDLSLSLRYFISVAARFVRKLSRISDIESIRHEAAPELTEQDMEEMANTIPMIIGAEYIDYDFLEKIWADLQSSFSEKIKAYDGSIAAFFASLNTAIHPVGRVFFHLVENKNGPLPFAFMATYSSGTGPNGKPKHRPLKQALVEYETDQDMLIELLTSVYSAAEKSAFLSELIDTGELFHPLSWDTEDTFCFLKEIPLYETSGILCRIPDWWKQKTAKPSIQISLGDSKPSQVGMDALMTFNASIHLGSSIISEAEARQLLEETEGLAFIKNKWVPVDHDKLKQALKACDELTEFAGDGLNLRDAMRLHLTPEKMIDGKPDDLGVTFSHGDWLASILKKLKNGADISNISPDKLFRADLRKYQQHGLNWLFFMDSLKFGACLADDMGLGKTIQVLAFLSTLKKRKATRASLLIVPASLISNWLDEIERFAPGLKVVTAHPGFTDVPAKKNSDRGKQFADSAKTADLVITSYALIQKYEQLHKINWFYVILDEAQAIKNPATKQTRTVKKLKSENRIAMTGTPIENRLADIWSLFDFVNPGLLGNRREFSAFAKNLTKNPEGYGHLRQVVSPYILRRLKTDKSVISDLPDKVEMNSYSSLSKKQVTLYQNAVKELRKKLAESEGIQRRGIVLSTLMKFKQLCNHPDQITGTGDFLEKESGKFIRLREICETIREKRERVIVFTQFKEMTGPLQTFLTSVFDAEGLVLHGGVPVKKRKTIIEKFQQNAWCPFMVLSIKAGGVGLNLTKANHVIHFDRWWNPAVENQATDRAFRIGQQNKVMVHKFITKGTIEEKIDLMLKEKQELSDQVISMSGEKQISEMDTNDILNLFKLSL